MAVVAHLYVKMPTWRLKILAAVIPAAAWLVRSEALRDRLVDVSLRWVQRGMRVYVGEKRVE